jgi:hypothetical protein
MRSIPEPNSGCHLWEGSTNKKGYGTLTVERVSMSAHVVSLETKLGRKLNPDEWALHKCDTPSCVNPDHLFAGTARDNTADMMRKGRQAWK